jgi:hypothetical protein
MKAHFNNYELAYKSCGDALNSFIKYRDEARNIVSEIVKELQIEKGYVKFAYGHRPYICGGLVSGYITYIRYNYEEEELQILTREQNIKPEKSKEADWSSLRLVSDTLCCYGYIVEKLESIVKK